MKTTNAIKKWTLTSVLLTLALGSGLLFQNCSSSSAGGSAGSQEKSIAARNGNGDGYSKADGTYKNADTKNECPGEDDSKSEVLVKDGNAYLTRDNCKDIEPQPLTSSVESLEHNTDVLFYKDRLFEKHEKASDVYSDVVCRGVTSTSSDGTVSYADVSMKKKQDLSGGPGGVGPSAIYVANVKTGAYHGDALVRSQNEAVENVYKLIHGDRTSYLFTKPISTSADPDQIRRDQESKDSYGLTVQNTVGEFYYNSKKLAAEFKIRDMDCYQH